MASGSGGGWLTLHWSPLDIIPSTNDSIDLGILGPWYDGQRLGYRDGLGGSSGGGLCERAISSTTIGAGEGDMGSDAGSGSSDDEVDESRWPISSSGQGGTGAGSATNSTGDCGSGSSCGRGAAGVSAAIASAVIIIASAAIAVAAVVAEDMGEATSSCRMCWVLSLLARLSTLVRGRDSAGSSRSVPGAGATGGESRGAGPVVSLGDTPTSSGPEGFTWVPMAKRSNMATVCRLWLWGVGVVWVGWSLGVACL